MDPEKRRRTSSTEAASAAIELVQQVQNKIEEINDAVAEQILRIQSEANKERAPVYESRRAAIANVPAFWKCTFQGHPWMSNVITER